ncbi:hypothetical protein [Novosphingobium sp.]|jgi:hypothetical protein|uniref:hypothetical protein n=1 Tax=Novosphingobium sp. TaxID=1874826 RepID=UPI0028D5DFAC|nr:hypothetical protein [uncultured Novosphingobium sp.]
MRGRKTGTRILLALGTLALCAPGFSGTARADDPNDRMSAEDIARDAAIIRKLNRDQLDYVRKRDAQYASGWKAYRARQGGGDEQDDEATGQYARGDYAGDEDGEPYARRDERPASSSPSRAYAQARRDYEADLAQWRRDVSACRAGDYSRCER